MKKRTKHTLEVCPRIVWTLEFGQLLGRIECKRTFEFHKKNTERLRFEFEERWTVLCAALLPAQSQQDSRKRASVIKAGECVAR